MTYPHVLIIGGGFAGLNCAKALDKAAVKVSIIDKTNHHLFQPLLYQVASAALSPSEIAVPLREVFYKQKNTSVVMGEVIAIRKDSKQVVLLNGDILKYDYLILAPGTSHSYFGNDHWEDFAPGLKTIADSVQIREQILLSYEKAERSAFFSKPENTLNFAIIGGGPTGVEMAGSIAEIAHKTLQKNFRHIHPERSKIYLVEAAPHILPSYSSTLAAKAQRDLEKLGVVVITGKKVTNITAAGIQVENIFYPCASVIWAAGNQASPLLKTLEIPLDKQGRAIVESDLSIPGNPEIFVIGDAACAIDKHGKALPGIAPAAIQQGKYIAKLIKNVIANKNRYPFKYFDKGSMATIGKAKAIVAIGKFHITGTIAWLIWCFIHIMYLIGFRNRIGVFTKWMFFYLLGQRGSRIIHSPIDQQLSREKPESIVNGE